MDISDLLTKNNTTENLKKLFLSSEGIKLIDKPQKGGEYKNSKSTEQMLTTINLDDIKKRNMNSGNLKFGLSKPAKQKGGNFLMPNLNGETTSINLTNYNFSTPSSFNMTTTVNQSNYFSETSAYDSNTTQTDNYNFSNTSSIDNNIFKK